MRGERRVGGLYCHQVLALLSDYVDDELDLKARQQVEKHLRGCSICERFGGEFAAMVGALRRELRQPPKIESDVVNRLRRHLHRNGAATG